MTTKDTVIELVGDYNGGPVKEDQTFADLGFDSLEFVDVLAQIEAALKCKIDNNTASHIRTVHDLIQAADLSSGAASDLRA